MSESLETTTRGAVRLLHMTGKPSRGNPLSGELTKALLDALVEAEQDDAIRAIVISGTERHFSVGADLREVDQLNAVDAVLADWLEEHDRIAAARKPLVAAVRGHAVGGGFELALACDLMVCAQDARLSLPETGIGVIAGQGGTQRVLQRAGRAVAADLILTGRVLDGDEAVQMGIASRAVACERVVDEALTMAAAIAERSPPAVRFAREVLREASEGHMRQSLRMERLLASIVLDTEERRTRVGAFLAEADRRRTVGTSPNSDSGEAS